MANPVKSDKAVILLVDDTDAQRYAVRRTLSNAGFEVLEAASGYDALAKARQLPDLVLLDINLPDINGFEVCKRIKADPLTADIPVMHLSATYINPQDRVTGLTGGADAYMVHPVNGAELIATISALLRLKQSEEAARRAAMQWQKTFDASKDAIWILDKDQNIIRFNCATESFFNINAEDILSKTCWEIVHGTAGPIDGCPMLRAKQTLTRENAEFAFGDKWFEVTVDPILDKDGQFDGAVHIYADITDRKRIQLALLESEALFRALAENSPAAIFIYQDELFVYANEIAQKLIGYPESELYQKRFWDVVHPDDRELVRERGLARLRGEAVVPHYEFKVITSRGEEHWVDFAGGSISYHGKTAGIGFAYDITERKRVQDELLKSESNFHLLVDYAPEAIYIQTQMKFVYLNNAARKLFGADSADQLLGQPVMDRFHPDYRAMIRERINRLNDAKMEAPSIEEKYLKLDGTAVDVIVSAVPFNYQNRDGALVFVRDITELKRVEAELQAEEEKSRQVQKLEVLGQMVSGIAHDFNNILGVIMGHASLMRMGSQNPENLDKSLKTIEKSSKRGAELVKQMMTFARKSEPLTEPVNLNELVTEIVAMLYETFPKIIEIRTDQDTSVPFILADANQIHQVLMNLCINARDAMPHGGQLSLATRLESGDTVRRRRKDMNKSEYVVLSVSDTGTGMDKQTLERIFEPFFTTKEKGKGTGLGLATVYGIVRDHNGFIDVASKPGEGTMFEVFLPVPSVAQNVSQSTEEFAAVVGGTETILLIEDEEAILNMVDSALKAGGYQVLQATDGVSGVEIYTERREQIDLVITDLGLPRLTGDKVFQQIRQINPKAKIILSSGYIGPELKSELYKNGLERYVQKPHLPVDLLRTIRDVLDNT